MTQPLHVDIRTDDVGGNKYPIIWNGQHAELHELWDSLMVSERLADFASEALPREAMADAIYKRFAPSVSQNAIDTDVATWASEASALSALVYLTPQDGDVAKYYYPTVLPVLEQQLFRAGYRIASLLNWLFDETHDECNESFPPYSPCNWRAPLCMWYN